MTLDKKQQWAIIFILALVTMLVLALPILAYHLTGNWLTFTPSLGSIPLGFAWTWIVRRVFPLNKIDHKRALAKIKYNSMKRYNQKAQKHHETTASRVDTQHTTEN